MIEHLPDTLNPAQFASLADALRHVTQTHGERPAFTCLGHTLTYAQIDALSDAFARFLTQKTPLQPGDRIAVQLPNLLQFPVVVYGAIKAGLIVVNTNPLYTAREMRHQFIDSGVRAIVILANFADKLEQVLPDTDIETVIVTELGDLHPPLRRWLINSVTRHIKKLVPKYSLPKAIPLRDCLSVQGELRFCSRGGNDVAVLLYTGGTTGYAKGVMLTHRNLLANMMQTRSRCLEVIRDREDTIVAPLPLYHSYAFMFHCLVMPLGGNHNLLIPNPRDLPALITAMRSMPIHGFVGLNTLFLALMNHPDFRKVDFSLLRFSGAGGMPLTRSVAEEWQQVTGCEIFEGYGLTECSPVVSVNRIGQNRPGTVGPPVPETEVRVVDDTGVDVATGDVGELWVRGPQVMLGYWGLAGDTAQVLDSEGWFKSGDFARLDADGFIRIVDRKKDMILVSGFNVIPGEIEEYVNAHPQVKESAAIGIPNAQTGESVVLYVVPRADSLTKEALLSYCREGLTPYKVPRLIIFTDDLPKSNVGKVLRRALREKHVEPSV